MVLFFKHQCLSLLPALSVKKLHEIALRVDTATDEELSKFEERPALVRGSLKILRDCNLNVYRSSSPHDLSH